MTFLALNGHFHFKKIEMIPFSGSTTFWRLLGESEPLVLLFGSVQGLEVCEDFCVLSNLLPLMNIERNH